MWNEERSKIFQISGSLVWSLFGLYVINLFWPPLMMMSFVGIVIYSFNKFSKFLGDDEVDDSRDEVDSRSAKRMKFRKVVLEVLNRMNSSKIGKSDIF